MSVYRGRSIAVALAFSLTAVSSYAQNARFAPDEPTRFSGSAAAPLSAPAQGTPAQIVSRFLADRGVFVPPASLVASGDSVNARGNVTSFRLEQVAGGVRVYGVYARVALTSGGELVSLIENLLPGTPSVAGSRGNEASALNAALQNLYPDQRPGIGNARREGDTTVFARTPFFHRDPRVTQVAVPVGNGALISGLLVETWREQGNQLHHTLVGPGNEILNVEERTNSDSYFVFPESPLVTPTQTTVPGPVQSPGSSTGWLFSGDQKRTDISGNNVHAYLDTDNNNQPDAASATVSNGTFDSVADLATAPSTTSNREVAVQNLFYLNNIVHDALYTHGFNEAAGNFQQNSTGGTGNDPVLAEAQDGGGTDNANFATPADGSSPRMQMYLWTGIGGSEVQVGATHYVAVAAGFGAALTTTGVTGNLANVNDGTAPTNDGCTSFTVPAGSIAIIERGNCDFTVKVANAQAGGAAAVIMTNNVGTTDIIPMGGTNRRIRIPAVMVGKNDGATLRGLGSVSATERKTDAPLQRDGTVDSDIVFHEYGHGLTWRMIGSMSGPMSGAIGEGASDGVALLMNGDDAIGEYSASSGLGIRRDPYTNYPRTYVNVTGSEVHDDGEVFAAIVWRLRQIFVTDSQDLNRLFNLYVDGMNFTPSAPKFEDMRDGMLQSAANDATFGAADTCRIWTAFANFGVGPDAKATLKGKRVTVVEDKTIPAGVCP